MKDAWSEENDKIELSSGSHSPANNNDHRPSLLSGLTQPPDRSTIVASIPSREATDKLVTRFFQSYNPATPAKCELIPLQLFDSHSLYPRCYTQSHVPQTGMLIFSVELMNLKTDSV
jgi:hypothetical protein